MPDPPVPAAGAERLPKPSAPLTLNLKGEDDNWVGALEVCWLEQDRIWCWQPANNGGKLIQDGRDLHMAGEQSHEQAMKVLLQFLLATADKPLSMFYDATTVWAVMNRKPLAKALESL